jgi:hypothetical protein
VAHCFLLGQEDESFGRLLLDGESEEEGKEEEEEEVGRRGRREEVGEQERSSLGLAAAVRHFCQMPRDLDLGLEAAWRRH